MTKEDPPLIDRQFSVGDELRLGTTNVRVLVTEQQVRERVNDMGARLRDRFPGDVPIFIGLLTGGVVFLSDLVRAYGGEHQVDFLKVSRYDPTRKDPTALRVVHDLGTDIRGRVVVLVEGARARGTKIQYVDRFLRLHEPKSIEYYALIEPEDAQRSVPLNDAGFRIDKEFVVGYGLDFEEHYRNLPFIGALTVEGMPRVP